MGALTEVRCPCGNLLIGTSRDSGRGLMTCLVCGKKVCFDIREGEVRVRVEDGITRSWPVGGAFDV